MSSVGDRRGKEDLSHVRSGGCSVTHVLSGGWERRGGSLPSTHWSFLVADGEERRINVMYVVGVFPRFSIIPLFYSEHSIYVCTNN